MWLYKSNNGIDLSRQCWYEDNTAQWGTENVVTEEQPGTFVRDRRRRSAVLVRRQQAARCKWLQGATNLHLIHRHRNCKPGTSLLSLAKGCGFTPSYTLARLQQSALGCRSRAGVTRGCRYSQMPSAKGCKDEQSTDALRESQPSHLHYCYHNRQFLGDCHVIGKITLCCVVIGFITCNPQASGVCAQRWAQL